MIRVSAPLFRQAATVSSKDVSYFNSIIGDSHVVTSGDMLDAANVDWMGSYKGHSKLLLRPKSTDEVSKILGYCNENVLPVVPQGGNTGLVGGSVPINEEIVMSLSRMDSVRKFDDVSSILTCDAGCILENLDNYLKARNHTMPLDLGAKGSCQIGGNVSTNAGGIRYIRYGSLHGTVLGVEAVKADGTVLDCLSELRKDNVGYDLKQLFIGSEGTLGVITGVSLQVPRLPSSVNVAMFGTTDFPKVCEALKAAKGSLGEVLSAIEFVDRRVMDAVLDNIPGTRDPMESDFPFYVLVETSGSNAAHDAEKLSLFMEDVMDKGIVEDGVVAQDEKQAGQLWALREMCAAAMTRTGHIYKYDLSVPLTEMYDLVEEVRERLRPFDSEGVFTVGYGHLGDSNLHLNTWTPGEHEEVYKLLEPFIFEWTAERNGSISAEHGLGQAKNNYMYMGRSTAEIALMRQMKSILDPNNILNPNKVLPLQ